MGDTNIAVTEPVADELYDRKSRGESYDDVLRRVLGIEDAAHAAHGGESA
jgi:hypothetical protein